MLKKFCAFEVLAKTLVPRDASPAQLRRLAHRVEFDYEPRPGFLYVRSRAISSRCNDNFDEFPAAEIKAAYKTFIGKPVFVNHHNDNHRRARGVIIDAALHEDRNADGSPDTWAEVLMEVDAVRFPKLAKAILAGHIDRTSMGTDVAYSICSACNNKASSPAEYCDHIPRMKGKRIYRATASGRKEGVLIRETCYGLGFFENSLLVEEPADPTAYVWGVDDRGLKASASKQHPRLDGVSLDQDDDGYFVKTHRARSDSYDSPEAIPDSAVEFIRSTGARTAALLPQDHGEHGPWNAHGQCKKCGFTPETEEDEECDHPYCQGTDFADGWHTKGEHMDPPHLDPYHPDYQDAERAVNDAFGEDNLGWLLDQQHTGPSKYSALTDPYLVWGHRVQASKADEFLAANPPSAGHLVERFLAATPEQHDAGMNWYADAHQVAKAIGHGDVAKAAGLMGVYSSGTPVAPNYHYASRSIIHNKAVGGKVNPIPPEYSDFHGKPNATAKQAEQAARILAGEHHSRVLFSPKVSNYAHLIEHGDNEPDAERERVVIDRHAVSAVVGRRITDAEFSSMGLLSSNQTRVHFHVDEHGKRIKGPDGKPVKSVVNDYGTDMNRQYQRLADVYREAADRLRDLGHDVKPHQVQAVTWLVQKARNDAEDEAHVEANGPQAGNIKGRQNSQRRQRDAWERHYESEHDNAGAPANPRGHWGAKTAAFLREPGAGYVEHWAEPAGEADYGIGHVTHADLWKQVPEETSAVAAAEQEPGPFYLTRHPVTRAQQVVDSRNRLLGSMPAGHGDGDYGRQSVEQSWHAANVAKGHIPEGTDVTEALMRHPQPPFATSTEDPEDTERKTRPAARAQAPEGHSPSEEWHGPYEVTQHPGTGQFHVVDNAGRAAPGPYNGFPDQLSAERSRDYVDRRQQSKEKAKGLAENLWGGVMDVLDPGGTDESRRTEKHTRNLNDLMHRYQGGEVHPLTPGRFGADDYDRDGDGEGEPYYEVTDPGGSGWKARDYGGPNLHVYHAATGETAHDLIDVGDPAMEYSHDRQKPPGYGHEEMHTDLQHWIHGDPADTEPYGAGKDYARNDPAISRWQRRKGYTGSARRSAMHTTAYGEIKAPADVDTLRDDTCPVCGEEDSYDGNRCQVCGFDAPPAMFRDPDLELARNFDLRKDIAEDAGQVPGQAGTTAVPGQGMPAGQVPNPEPISPDQLGPNGEVQVLDPNGDPVAQEQALGLSPETDPEAAARHFNQGGESFTPGPNAPTEPGQPEGPENEEQVDPEQLDENGQPVADDGQPVDPGQGQGAPGTPADGVADLMCPACGFSADAAQPTSVDMDEQTLPQMGGGGTMAGDVCPNCGQAQMVSAGEMAQAQQMQQAGLA